MTSCCCELSQLPSCRNAGANRDRTSLPRGVRTALSPKRGGEIGEKAQPCPLNRRTFLTPPLCVCYTLDKLLKCTPALQHVCCRPPCEGVGRNLITRRKYFGFIGRPPCEGVGRNLYSLDAWDGKKSRPPCEGVGRNTLPCSSSCVWCSRPPCEGVGRNSKRAPIAEPRASRPPCEGVGRNIETLSFVIPDRVALHVRAWVEISVNFTDGNLIMSPSM